MTKVEQINIKDLVLLKNNPRKISKDEIGKLAGSIEKDPEFFNNRPVLVNRVGGVLNVYAGNQRIHAAKRLKWKQVPCIIEDDLSEDVVKERIIKDNKHSGSWDYDILANEWDINFLIECGFTEHELELTVQADEVKSDKEEKEEKLKMCPSCGHEF